MARVLAALAAACVLLAPVAAAPSPAPAPPPASAEAAAPGPDIEAFVREGCPHCAKAEAFLADLAKERPELRIAIRDVSRESAALERLKAVGRESGTGGVRVPAILVRGQLIVGYSPEAGTGALILDALASRSPAAPAKPGGAGTCEAEESQSCADGLKPDAAPKFEVTAFGRTVTLDDVGLPAFTLVMGLLDGLNPCSMWVLILMISLLAPLNDRPRMLAIAGTFVAIQGIAYFGFLAAWLNVFLFIGLSRASEIAIAAIAIVAGLINLKDFWRYGWGVSLSIPQSSKPGIYARMRGILHAEHLGAAIVATIVLAVLVQFVELLCTSGFPALFTRILTLRQLEGASYYGYLLLYIAAYMMDDVIVLAIGVATLSKHRLQEKEGRWLKLVSGLAMVALGAWLLFGASA